MKLLTVPPLTGSLALAIFTTSLSINLLNPPLGLINHPKIVKPNEPDDAIVYFENGTSQISYRVKRNDLKLNPGGMSYDSFLESLSWTGFGQMIGFQIAWCVTDSRGRVRGLTYANNIRIFATLIFLLNVLIFWGKNGNEDPPCRLGKCFQLSFFPIFAHLSYLFEGIHSGLSTFIGSIYCYELSPTGSAPSILSGFALLHIIWNISVAYMLPHLTTSSVEIQSWALVGVFSLAVGMLQAWLLNCCCPETPSYLAIHQGSSRLALASLHQIRRDRTKIESELEVILQQESKSVRGAFKRSVGVIILLAIYGICQLLAVATSFYFGALNMQIRTLMIIYMVTVVGSFLTNIFFNSHIQSLRSSLFLSYTLLTVAYVLIAGLTCLQTKLTFFVVLVSVPALVVYLRCCITSAVLIFQYTGCLQRVNLICGSGFIGGILSALILLGVGLVCGVVFIVAEDNPMLFAICIVSLVLIRALTKFIQNIDPAMNIIAENERLGAISVQDCCSTETGGPDGPGNEQNHTEKSNNNEYCSVIANDKIENSEKPLPT